MGTLPSSGHSLVALRASWLPDRAYETHCKTHRIWRGSFHIWFQNAYAFPVHFSGYQPMHLLPSVYTGASCWRNHRLTTLSMVNTQHPQDNSQYSNRSQQCCSLGGLHSSPDFQFLESIFQTRLGPFQVHQLPLVSPSPTFFLLAVKVQVFVYLFASFYSYSVIRRNGKILLIASSFLRVNTWSGLLAEIQKTVYISKFKEFRISHSLGRILIKEHNIWLWDQISIFCTIPHGSTSQPNQV